MIIDNRLTEIGDQILVSASAPIVGMVQMLDYSSILEGETSDRYFIKEFRCATDGLNMSNWMMLNQANVQSVVTDPAQPLLIEYRFTRAGANSSGDLLFWEVAMLGTVVTPSCPKAFKDSIFSSLVSCFDPDVLVWCNNVLEKLYRKGVVAEYLTRNTDGDFAQEDEDYISFWRAISCFFAVIVTYGRRLMDYNTIKSQMSAYLQHRGIYVSDSDDINDIKKLMSEYMLVMTRRGGHGGAMEELPSVIGRMVNDEFMYYTTRFSDSGWVVGSSSPEYNHNNSHPDSVKAYDKYGRFDDISLYPIHGQVSVVQSGEQILIHMGSEPSGIGEYAPSNYGVAATRKYVPIDNKLSYEVSFMVRAQAVGMGYMSVGVNVLNKDSQPELINWCFGSTNWDWRGIAGYQLIPQSEDRWQRISLIIFGVNHRLLPPPEGSTELQYGMHLKFSSGSKFAQPVVSFTGGGDVYIKDFSFRLLSSVSGIGGDISGQQQFIAWIKNNNGKMLEDVSTLASNNDISGSVVKSSPMLEEYMRDKIIPYNLVNNINIL